MFSVEMLPDAVVEAAVRHDWQVLIDAGLPSAGRHGSESNRPHVTVALCDEIALADSVPIASALPIPITLGGAVVFAAGERFVLARPVVMSAALLDFHRSAVSAVGPPPERYAVTAVDAWTPHITLARRMTAEQVGRALAAVGAAPVSGELVGLRVWDSEARVVTPVR